MKSICVLITLLSSVTGAAAGEYYIVQDASTRHCTIVEMPPTTTQFVVLEKGKVFFDRDEAKEVVGSLTLCSSKTVSAVASPSGQDQVGKSKGRTAAKGGTAANKAARMAHSQSARSRAASAQSESVRSRAEIAHVQSLGSAHPFSSFFSLFR